MKVNGQFHTLATLPWYSFHRRLGELQSQYGHDGKEKKIPAPARN
jgi:hypothetical protein